MTSDEVYAGEVEDVVGDETADIFDGLSVRIAALETPRYVPAEQVGSIVDGAVRLQLTSDELAAQPEHTEPAASVQISPAEAVRPDSDVERLASIARPGPASWWHRLRRKLGGRA